MCNLIDLTFEMKEREFVNVNSNLNKVSWSKIKNTRVQYSFNKENVKCLLRYIIENIYIKFRGKVYKQNIGVPMGCDCAPFLANLYLFCYEYQYIKDLDTVNNSNKEYFKFCCRFIDDLWNPNGIEDFVSVAKSIYPNCLV